VRSGKTGGDVRSHAGMAIPAALGGARALRPKSISHSLHEDNAKPAPIRGAAGERRNTQPAWEAAIGAQSAAGSPHGIASPQFVRRVIIIIMVAMFGGGVVLGLTHTGPNGNSTTVAKSPASEPPMEMAAPAMSSDRAAVAAAPAPAEPPPAPVAPGSAPVALEPGPSAIAIAPTSPQADDHIESSDALPPAAAEAAPPQAAPEAQAVDKKPPPTKTATRKAAPKKPAAKHAAAQGSAAAEAPAPAPEIDITAPR
jgi:hypothetical protein